MNSDDLLPVHTGTVREDDSLTLEQLCQACGPEICAACHIKSFNNSLTLGQLCQTCSIRADWIVSLVEESIIEPQGDEMHLWRFSGASLMRVRSALRLQRDLGVNLAGIALTLDLMEELENLRTQLKIMGRD